MNRHLNTHRPLLLALGLASALLLALAWRWGGADSVPLAPDGVVSVGDQTGGELPTLAPVSGAPSHEEPGHQGSSRQGVEERKADAQSQTAGSFSIHGRVLDWDGQPVVGFRIGAFQRGQGAQSQNRRFENVDGTFKLDGLSPGRWTLFASAASGFMSEQQIVEVPHGGELVLVCAPDGGVSGTVVHSSGAPVAGATVLVKTRPAVEQLSTVSGADGSFVIAHVPPGGAVLDAQFKDYVAVEPQVVDIRKGHHVSGVVLQLGLSGRLTGTVEEGLWSRGVGEDVSIRGVGFPDVQAVACDDGGLFEFPNLRPDLYEVRVLGPEGRETVLGPITAEVEAGATRHIYLGQDQGAPITIQGRVTLDGKPAPGELLGYPEGRGGSEGPARARIGREGGFELTVKGAGPYVLRTRTGAGRVNLFYVSVQYPPAGDYHLELPAGSLSGTVVLGDDSPVQGGGVLLEMLGSHNHLRDARSAWGWGGRFRVKTDEAGRWSFDGLAAGTYSLFAHGPGQYQEPLVPTARLGGITLGDGEGIEGLKLVARLGGAVWCEVKDLRGKPVNGAALFARDSSGAWVNPVSTTSTLKDGRNAIIDLSPGRYSFVARARHGVSDESPPIEIPEAGARGFSLDDAPTVKLQIVPGGGLKARLFDSQGKAVRANFTVFDSQGRKQSGTSNRFDTTRVLQSGFQPGSLTLTPLLPGRYRVTAVSAGGCQANGEIDVVAGSTAELVLCCGL